MWPCIARSTSALVAPGLSGSARSEERRVGKECRYRGPRRLSKKNRDGQLQRQGPLETRPSASCGAAAAARVRRRRRTRSTPRAAASFFFQAEDGIRDLYVTGVQTCALPILSWA